MANQKVVIGVVLLVVVGVAVGVGVGLYLKNKNDGGDGAVHIPYVTPPVAAACPSGLKGGLSGLSAQPGFRTQSLNTQEIIDRFFNPTGGPTNLFDILLGVDARLQGINDRFSQFADCMSTTPTAYSLNTAWAASPTFYVQCSDVWGGGGSGFDQFGQVGSTTYLYVRGGDTIVAAKLVGNGTFGNIDTVTVWYSVGIVNRGGSHAVVMVYAQPASSIFEMSVAGVNVGYCGAQLKSDGVSMNVTGSADGCQLVDSACTSATSLSTPSTCNAAVNTFSLPALGRKAYVDLSNPASMYPGGSLNTVTLANTGLDDTFFGPSSPTV